MNAVRNSVLVLALVGLASLQLSGQDCASGSKYANTIACLPTVVGDHGAFSAIAEPVFDSSGNFVGFSFPYGTSPTQSIATPMGLGAQYATQIATSPSVATSSGYVLSTTSGGGISARPADLGPLLSDVPQTIGRHRLFIGTSYQWMEFSKTGGQDMRSYPYPLGFAIEPQGLTGFYGFIDLQASASLKMHSIDTYASFGLTSHLDVAVVVPWSKSEMSFHSSCSPTYQWTVGNTKYCSAYFLTKYIDESTGLPVYDFAGFLAGSSGSARNTGIGDVTLRAKYQFWRSDLYSMAGGVEYRLPTGDPLNIHGSGATGVRPFFAWGYNARVAPHVNIGYQYNGSSVNDVRDNITGFTTSLAPVYGPPQNSTKLPNILTGSAGFDAALTRRLNLDGDFLVRRFSSDGRKDFVATENPFGGTNPVSSYLNPLTSSPYYTGAKIKATGLVGVKAKLAGHLMLSASALIDAGGYGMVYHPAPTISISYDMGHAEE
jgi:hypothetical protein